MIAQSFDESFNRVRQLVAKFRQGQQHYLSPAYNEAEARQDFIDDFWMALGWDVRHQAQSNPYEQEVKVERNVNVSGRGKRADYAFLAPNFRDVQFFVEAKKPSRNIDNRDDYFQTIRYGWNSHTPLAALTDFEQFRVLDCRYKPDIDTVLQRAVKKYHFTEYEDPERLREIYHLFSREAVRRGSLERFAEALPKISGKAARRAPFGGGFQSIDESFLQELDRYRDRLARSFKSCNPWLDSAGLTEVTQRALDRLVFMRFLEDKLIERQPLLESFGTKGTAWQDFIAASRRLDQVYNGIIFKRHDLLDSADFRIDEAVFEQVRERLSHANSPYDFNAIPIHILGSIYERFLGKTIVATGGEARVEAKPEVRKAGGVYYTPEYIVRYIVENTVGKLIAGKTPEQIAEMRFADIACGSGSFLLSVYDLLLAYHTTYYNRNKTSRDKGVKAGCLKRDDGTLQLSLWQKQRILVNNIYGVDIDRQAVEVAQLSLYLKLLEEETTASSRAYQLEFGQRLLPSLNQNIVSGNSLIGLDILRGRLFDDEEERKLNAMDFKSVFGDVMKRGGFDAVVGNPPYDVMEKERGESSWPHTALNEYVRVREDYKAALGGKLNLFRFFIIQCLSLTRDAGKVGMIVPLALLADISCARTRRHLLLSTDDLEADCFPQKDNPSRRVFAGAKLSTMIFAATKSASVSPESARIRVRVYAANSFKDERRESVIHLTDTAIIDPVNTPIPLVDATDWTLCKRVYSLPSARRLGEVEDFSVTRGEINQTIYRQYITDDSSMARLLKGVEVGRYYTRERLSQGHREWFDEKRFLESNARKPVVDKQRVAIQRITGVDERLRLVATLITPPAYFADSTNSIICVKPDSYRLEYLLGLLNSWFFQWRFKITSTNNNVGTNELESLPFRTIDFSDPEDKARHDLMVRLVEQMLSAKGLLARAHTDRDKAYYENKCAALDRQIDLLVYELYGLSGEEVAIVEAAV
jgi:Alw26I/Eco31I/Esp3I family type II restriction m6 adenine DNA methyltransferase